MSFLRKIGSFAGSALKKVGSFSGAVSKIANSGAVRTIATAIGAAGKTLTPLVAAAAPELAGATGVANKIFGSLQNGSALNKVSNIADRVGRVSNALAS